VAYGQEMVARHGEGFDWRAALIHAMAHTLIPLCMILVVCIYYMMCNVVSYIVHRYSMLNGVIDSREMRRVKAAGSSQSSGATSHHRSRQGAIKDARLQEVIA
jgi:uncharacterized membrane protein YgcG